MADVRAHLFVTGQVQGVFFRAACAHEAKRAGVRGWVRNLADGRVEAVFEGESDAVTALCDWCRRGPDGAKVTHVEQHLDPPEGERGFEVRGTAT